MFSMSDFWDCSECIDAFNHKKRISKCNTVGDEIFILEDQKEIHKNEHK